MSSGPSPALKLALRSNFSWRVLVSQRAVARLRCGLVLLGHRSGKPSCAKSQSCLFCGCTTDHLWAHVFGECPAWAAHRQAVVTHLHCDGLRSWDFMYRVVSATAEAPGYDICALFVAEVVGRAELRWKEL